MNYIDWSIICNLIGKIVGIVLVGLATYITPKAVAWLEQKKLYVTAQSLVECAEQTLAGSKLKKDYVLAVLKDLGYEENPHLNAVVEGLVFELKQKKKFIEPSQADVDAVAEKIKEFVGVIPMNEPSVESVTETSEVCEDCIVRLD